MTLGIRGLGWDPQLDLPCDAVCFAPTFVASVVRRASGDPATYGVLIRSGKRRSFWHATADKARSCALDLVHQVAGGCGRWNDSLGGGTLRAGDVDQAGVALSNREIETLRGARSCMTAVASAALGEDRLNLRSEAGGLCECALFDGVDADVACLILGANHKVVGHSGG